MNVWWLCLNADAPSRGYWDQAFIGDLLDGRWRPAGWRPPAHHEVRRLPDSAPAGVVVLPARQHAHLIAEVNAELAKLPGVVLVLTGDEEQTFPREKLDHPNLALWVMGPLADAPTRDDGRQVTYLGSGYSPHVRNDLPRRPWRPDRPIDWSFAGQVTHTRREMAYDVMRRLTNGHPEWTHSIHPTDGFAKGLSPADYTALLADSKIVVCPPGPVSPDSFRFYEAIEAGAVPVVDRAAGHTNQAAHWRLIADTAPDADLPFPSLDRWDFLPNVVGAARNDWPTSASRVGQWWNDRCWEYARRLAADATTVGIPPPADRPLCTAVISTSPVPASPELDHLDETIRSIRRWAPDMRIVLAVDGVRPEQEHLAPAWDEAVHHLHWCARHVWGNVDVSWDGMWRHQAGTVHRAVARVDTPTILFAEHDTPLVTDEPIPLDDLIVSVDAGWTDLIRLHHEAHVHPEHEHLMIGDLDTVGPYVPVRPTIQWSQRPHVASTAYYDEILTAYFTPDSRTMIEDTMHSVVQSAHARHGRHGWGRHRLHLFHPPGGNIKRSYHLDARGPEPKFGMRR